MKQNIMKQWVKALRNSLGRFETENFDGFFEESLADLNDSGKKFKTISNIIEKNWEVF